MVHLSFLPLSVKNCILWNQLSFYHLISKSIHVREVQSLFALEHALIRKQIWSTTNLCRATNNFQHLRTWTASTPALISGKGFNYRWHRNVWTHNTDINKPDHPSLTNMNVSTTLQLTLTGYSASIIVPFSPAKTNLCQGVLWRHPSTKQWKAETGRKRETKCGCVKKEKKFEKREPVPEEKPK